jgi:hypothetical protein
VIKTGKPATAAQIRTMTAGPCCGYRNGVYVNLKTGQPVTRPTAHITPCCAMRNGVYVNLKTGQPVTAPTAHEVASPKSGGEADPGGSMGHHGK